MEKIGLFLADHFLPPHRPRFQLMPFEMSTEEVDYEHEHRNAEHEHEIERKIANNAGYVTVFVCSRAVDMRQH